MAGTAMGLVADPGIAGVSLRSLAAHGDDRGSFLETFRQEWFPGAPPMVQTNLSAKLAGAVVGLHYHLRQADYWYVADGVARVGLFDLRRGSPTEGTAASFDMTGEVRQGLYIPRGVGHGFASLTDVTMLYQVDGYYDPEDELGVAWDDPALGIDWGVADPIISPRDLKNPLRSELAVDRLPVFEVQRRV